METERRYPHLDESTAEVADLPPERRSEYIDRPLWIHYPRAVRLLERMHEYMKMPKRARMRNIMVIGESNMGKTSILERFVEMNPRSGYTDETGMRRARVPVIMAQAPATADARGLFTAILDRFWTSFRPTDPVLKLRNHTVRLMREHETEMLVIDEIHNLIETSTVQQRRVLNELKVLGNELRIPIVVAGTDSAATILSTDPQMASRFDVARLRKWEKDMEFLALLKAFEKRLPLRKPSKLFGNEKSGLLLHISDGNLGNLHRLLAECAKAAIAKGEEEITAETIRTHAWIRPTRKNGSVDIPL